MQRKFITNVVFLLFLNLLIKPFWILGIDRVVQNKVGTEVYGQYYAILSFTFLINILLDLGITNFNKVNISQHRFLLLKHFSGIIGIRLLLGFFYAFVTLIIGFVVGFTGTAMHMLSFLVLNQFLISFILYLRSNLAGLLFFKTDSLISVIDRFLMIVICSLLLWGKIAGEHFEIMWFVYAQTSAYLLTAIIAFIVVLWHSGKFKLTFNKAFTLMILKKSFPFALLMLLISFYNRIDTVLLDRLLPNGGEQAGLYAQGYRLLDATNMIAYLFSGILLPIFARLIKEKKSVENLISLSFRILFTGAVAITLVCAIYSKEFIQVLYTEHFASGPLIFGILMSCFIPVSCMYVFGTLLTANQNLKQLNIIAASGMVLNIGLNVILIPHFQAIGAAIVSLITQTLTVAVQIIIVVKIFKFKINYTLLLKLLLFVIAALGIALFLTVIPAQWYQKALLTTMAILLLSFILRILSLKAVINILKQKK